ncbi:MAG: GNAT family N-acetyltransferase [Planctomycetaceae bacterium]|jgi:predicted N-acetyltransferase YhbS|nr:GNAT family N-acetyltransferase [Planctomycetaceae bacterium]MBT6154751.1 GNAT family N-acetyltransferase [Planctomycetaceae bacterium]MBT6485648.1 GNAT family N-acetyltransferase [Planctomycetaceae bacterium]
MTDELDIHRATESERIAAYRNVHEVWGGAYGIDEHVSRRLASVQHNRALWYVGCVDGRVVTSLGCFPLQFRIRGETQSGIAIGAVHTVPEFRGRGFAPQLIEWTESDQRQQGVTVSLLYSDIPQEYYERLGYLVCPSWEAKIETAAAFAAARELLQSSPECGFERISRFKKRPTLATLYDNYHASKEILINRDEAYWEFLLAKQPDDEYFLLNDPSGDPAGYVRLRTESERLLVRDFAVAGSDDLNLLLAHVVCNAADRNLPTVGGWLPDLPGQLAFIKLSQRAQEITMLKSLDASLAIDESVREAAQHFVEIDHV